MITAIVLLAANPWIKKLPSGSTLSLVAVTDPRQQKSWQPDGTAIPVWVYPEMMKRLSEQSGPSPNPDGIINFVVQLRPKAGRAEPTILMRIGAEKMGFSFTLLDMQRKNLWWSGAGKSTANMMGPVNLLVGVAESAWKPAGRYDLRMNKASGTPFYKSLRKPALRGAEGDPAIAVSAKLPDDSRAAYRLKVYASDGTSLQAAGSGAPGAAPNTVFYFTLQGKRPVAVEMQTRPYQWVTFNRVWPRPKK